MLKVTNHMTGGEGGVLMAALGKGWKSIPHVRLQLSREHGSDICNMCILYASIHGIFHCTSPDVLVE